MATDAAQPPVSTGHPIGFFFFFWGEFAERCSYYGMRAILSLYMIDRLGVDKADAGTYMSLFIAACYFFPLVGGYLADNYFGKYWTIVAFSIPYVVAQFLVGIENKPLVIASLVLLAMGSGVIKPNISTLMGMTYDQQRPGQDQLRTSAFSWFYMAINFGAAISQFVMPYLRTKYGYQTAFLFPAVSMSIALFFFAIGKRFYAIEKIERKVLTASESATEKALRWATLTKIGPVFLTVMFFWAIFDQAASTWIFFADTYMDCTLFGVATPADQIQFYNPVFIVLLVPVSVFIFKLYPVRATRKMILGFILTGLSMVIMSYAGFMAGKAEKVLKATFPEGELILPATKTALKDVKSDGTKLITITTEDHEVDIGERSEKLGEIQLTAKDWSFDEEKKKLNFTNGEFLANGNSYMFENGHLVSMSNKLKLVGSVLEPLLKSDEDRAKIKPEPATATLEVVDWVKPKERVTVWWQVLAYLILTIAEILISVTGLELAFVAAPQSMKSFVTACWLAVVFLANLLINAPITRLYPQMAPGNYFAMLAGAMVLVVIVFLPISARFERMMKTTQPVT